MNAVVSPPPSAQSGAVWPVWVIFALIVYGCLQARPVRKPVWIRRWNAVEPVLTWLWADTRETFRLLCVAPVLHFWRWRETNLEVREADKTIDPELDKLLRRDPWPDDSP